MVQRVEIVTGFSDKGYAEYGHRFLDSYEKFGIHYRDLIVYTHGIKEQVRPWVTQREQNEIPGLLEFLDKYSNPTTQGRKDPDGRWKLKELANGYSFRFDAHKFCRMVFVMHHAATQCKYDHMVWLDGDTVVRKIIPPALISRALPKDCVYSYLGRPSKYTETGFLVFKVPEILPILEAWVGYYKTGRFLKESEWHSAWLFDRARIRYPDLRGHNLTPNGSGHVIHQCWVGTIFDHCKGKRKRRGRSPEAK
jgi:hypothetical protein